MAPLPHSPPAPAQEQFDVPLMAIVSWTFSVTAYSLHGCVLVKFVAESLQVLTPTFSGKLVKEPVLGAFVRIFPAMEKLTLAHLTALIMMFGVCFFWREMLRIYLDPSSEKTFEVEPYKALVLPVGITLVAADALLFLLGITALSWGKIGFSFSALLVTVIMVTLNVFVALVSLRLKKAAEEEEERRKSR